jgi:hypothetical protein
MEILWKGTLYRKLVSIRSKAKQDISIHKNNEFEQLKLKITLQLTQQAELGIDTLLFPGNNIQYDENRQLLKDYFENEQIFCHIISDNMKSLYFVW